MVNTDVSEERVLDSGWRTGLRPHRPLEGRLFLGTKCAKSEDEMEDGEGGDEVNMNKIQ